MHSVPQLRAVLQGDNQVNLIVFSLLAIEDLSNKLLQNILMISLSIHLADRFMLIYLVFLFSHGGENYVINSFLSCFMPWR